MTDPTFYYVGNVVVDIVLTVPAVPTRGEDAIATSTIYTVGGGFNVMAAARRQGVRTVYGGAHGTGPLAARAAHALALEGISTVGAAIPDVDAGFVVVLVDDGGERTFVTSVGAEGRLDADRLGLIQPRAGDFVGVSGYSLLPARGPAALMAWLARLDPRVVVVADPGPLVGQLDPEVLAAIRRRADWWTLNAREATVVSGSDDAAAAARRLTGSSGGVVVRDGPRGCWVGVNGSVTRVPGFSVDAVDLNGAGDAHTGVFVAALARGLDPFTAAGEANAAAALAVTRRGPATGPTRSELSRFLARFPRRSEPDGGVVG